MNKIGTNLKYWNTEKFNYKELKQKLSLRVLFVNYESRLKNRKDALSLMIYK